MYLWTFKNAEIYTEYDTFRFNLLRYYSLGKYCTLARLIGDIRTLKRRNCNWLHSTITVINYDCMFLRKAYRNTRSSKLLNESVLVIISIPYHHPIKISYYFLQRASVPFVNHVSDTNFPSVTTEEP